MIGCCTSEEQRQDIKRKGLRPAKKKREEMLYRGTAALEVWARRSVAGKVEVANLAEDWRDGRLV